MKATYLLGPLILYGLSATPSTESLALPVYIAFFCLHCAWRGLTAAQGPDARKARSLILPNLSGAAFGTAYVDSNSLIG